MRQKKLVIGLLVMLALVVSGFTYAYWYSVAGSNADVTGQVSVGTGKSFTTSVTVSSQVSGSILVPAGMAAYSNEVGAVESVDLTFPVSWVEGSSTLTTETGTITVTVTNVAINSNTTLGATYVTVTVGALSPVTVNGSAVNVVLTVTLGEPADSTDYALIAGQDITFDVNFAVAVN